MKRVRAILELDIPEFIDSEEAITSYISEVLASGDSLYDHFEIQEERIPS